MSIEWDSQRFAGNVYAVKAGVTVARIVERDRYFDVFPCPDAPPRFHDEHSGITMDGFRSLDAAKAWIEEFASYWTPERCAG